MKTSTPTVKIVCPDWCAVDPQEHADELENWDGLVLHTSEWIGDNFRICSTRMPSGRLAPADNEPATGIVAGDRDRFYALKEIETLATDLLALVRTVRIDMVKHGLDPWGDMAGLPSPEPAEGTD